MQQHSAKATNLRYGAGKGSPGGSQEEKKRNHSGLTPLRCARTLQVANKQAPKKKERKEKKDKKEKMEKAKDAQKEPNGL